MVGVSHSHLGRVEREATGLTLDLAKRLAEAMGEDVADVLGIESEVPPTAVTGADAEPYTGSLSKLGPALVRRQNLQLWRIVRSPIDRAGVPREAIVYVDTSPVALSAIKDLACVLAETTDINGKPVVIARQFVPPGLLITNSSEQNEPSRDVSKGEAAIVGVLRGQYIALDS